MWYDKGGSRRVGPALCCWEHVIYRANGRRRLVTLPSRTGAVSHRRDVCVTDVSDPSYLRLHLLLRHETVSKFVVPLNYPVSKLNLRFCIFPPTLTVDSTSTLPQPPISHPHTRLGFVISRFTFLPASAFHVSRTSLPSICLFTA